MELRPYQISGIEAVREQIRSGRKRILLVAPTGSGKTCIAADIIRSAVNKAKSVLFIAHRREIIQQTSAKLDDLNIEHGVIMAGVQKSLIAGVQVASIQTLVRRNFPPADLVIFDECHHVPSQSYQRIIEHYHSSIVLGLTATPCRSDGRGLGNTFGSLVQAAQIKELITQGYLVPCVSYAPTLPDLRGVKVKCGDYDEGELGEAMDKPKLVGDIVDHWHRLGKGRKTIVYSATIAHSQHLTEAFKAAGVKVSHLDGETPHEAREKLLYKDFPGDAVDVVCNVGVLTEGTDLPFVSCIVLARPTKSLGLLKQMVGRGMRISPQTGKTDMILIDHAGAVHEHGLIDDDVQWKLETDDLAWSKKKYEKREPKPWICEQCFHINQPSRENHCERCGLVPVKTQQVAVGPGLLKEVEVTQLKKDDKAKIWHDCFWRAVKKRLKVGAAAHMYRQQTGVWPRGFEYMPSQTSDWQLRADLYYAQMKERV